jgi:hypothetical protein
MKAVDPRVTYAELEQWPDDGRRYELYDGEVIEVPTPLPIHQLVVLRTYGELKRYTEQHGGLALCAPLDIVFSRMTFYSLMLCSSTPSAAVELISTARFASSLPGRRGALTQHGGAGSGAQADRLRTLWRGRVLDY